MGFHPDGKEGRAGVSPSAQKGDAWVDTEGKTHGKVLVPVTISYNSNL